jgi:hydroxymethylbilane synthase
VSAYAQIEGNMLHLVGRVNSLNGTQTITVRGSALVAEADQLGKRLAEDARAQGAGVLLAEIQKGLPT